MFKRRQAGSDRIHKAVLENAKSNRRDQEISHSEGLQQKIVIKGRKPNNESYRMKSVNLFKEGGLQKYLWGCTRWNVSSNFIKTLTPRPLFFPDGSQVVIDLTDGDFCTVERASGFNERYQERLKSRFRDAGQSSEKLTIRDQALRLLPGITKPGPNKYKVTRRHDEIAEASREKSSNSKAFQRLEADTKGCWNSIGNELSNGTANSLSQSTLSSLIKNQSIRKGLFTRVYQGVGNQYRAIALDKFNLIRAAQIVSQAIHNHTVLLDERFKPQDALDL
ncbi:MAG: hypothetical protein J3Q66DRAFT_402438 [Benniella sp.]|nr:MAG: hypothetical protein J3Q66DRAFT_402438 [Benniella sp.]